jgi:hypothetical protein
MPKKKSYQKYLLFFICLLLFSAGAANGQTNLTINGSVITAEESEPLEGVTISIENEGSGSVTNAEGNFVLVLHDDVAKTDSITFSYIGFISQKVAVADAAANKNLIIKLKESVTNLKEVSVKPLSLRSLLDSIIYRNKQAFVSPVNLKGYYRETVYTNGKCSEYSDALCAYHFDRSAFPDGQFKINASRCLKEKATNDKKQNFEAYVESFVDPNSAFKYALLEAMINTRFPDKVSGGYDYDIQQTSDQSSGDQKIIISPKKDNPNDFYQLTLFLKSDFTLKSYSLDIPKKLASRIKERSMLGIHVKKNTFRLIVNYASTGDHIYPNYYNVSLSYSVTGKFMGTVINQVVENKSEFVVTEVDKVNSEKPFDRREVYKKGNICNNGAAINDALLKNYTIIKLTQKDSTAMRSLVTE